MPLGLAAKGKEREQATESKTEETALTGHAVGAVGGTFQDVQVPLHLPQSTPPQAASTPTAAPARQIKYLYFGRKWYKVGEGLTDAEMGPVPAPTTEGGFEDGDTYDPNEPDATKRKTTSLEHLVHLIQRLRKARRRERKRWTHGIAPKTRQSEFARISMRDHPGGNPLKFRAMSGTMEVRFVGGWPHMPGKPDEKQPFMQKEGDIATDYSTLAPKMDQVKAATGPGLIHALIRYDKTLGRTAYSDPDFSIADGEQRVTADLFAGLTLVECHFTRAMADGGKSMRAAIRAAGLMGFEVVFGGGNNVMMICRKGGNKQLRDLVNMAKRLHGVEKKAESMRTAEDLREKEEAESYLKSHGTKLSILDEELSESSTVDYETSDGEGDTDTTVEEAPPAKRHSAGSARPGWGQQRSKSSRFGTFQVGGSRSSTRRDSDTAVYETRAGRQRSILAEKRGPRAQMEDDSESEWLGELEAEELDDSEAEWERELML